MKRSDAIAIFGSIRKMAKEMDISTSAIYQWSDELSLRVSDRIVGFAIRNGYAEHPNVIAYREQEGE